MAEINEKIKEMRLKNNLTLLAVAEHLGVKEATAQRYESGAIKNIKYEVILKLAELFKCEPCYLMGWGDDVKTNEASHSTITNSAVVQGNNATTLIVKNGGAQERELSDQAVELLRIFETLSVREQTDLLSFAFQLEARHEGK